jgi:predicted RNase H-like nuclease (RuvC/YqgF family)
MRKYKMGLGEIYVILQNHFQSLTISRIQQSLLAGAQVISLDDPTCVDLSRALHDLRDELHRKEKQISNCNEVIQGAEWKLGNSETQRTHHHNSLKDQDICKSDERVRQAEDVIVEMMERQLELNIRREREISELTVVIEDLEQEISKQKANIAGLGS